MREAHRWVQLAASQANDVHEKGMIMKNTGFSYVDSLGNQMVEFHVDNVKLGDEEPVFGGKLSVCFPTGMKPLILIGHDECIFKQYCLSKKHWVSPCGTQVLVLKDEGQGVMVSAFQCREFGFDLEMTPEHLQRVIVERQGKQYKDAEVAISRLGTAYKKDLPKSAFIK
jgi:hypothetical protein